MPILFAKFKTLTKFRNWEIRKAGLSFLNKKITGSNRWSVNKIMTPIAFCLHSHSNSLGFAEKSPRRQWEILSPIQNSQRKSIKHMWTIKNNEYIWETKKMMPQLSITKKCLPSATVLPSTEGLAWHYCTLVWHCHQWWVTMKTWTVVKAQT